MRSCGEGSVGDWGGGQRRGDEGVGVGWSEERGMDGKGDGQGEERRGSGAGSVVCCFLFES